MIELANNSGKIIDIEKVRNCVLERKTCFTGVGKRILIPMVKQTQ